MPAASHTPKPPRSAIISRTPPRSPHPAQPARSPSPSAHGPRRATRPKQTNSGRPTLPDQGGLDATLTKVMAWNAFDRAAKKHEEEGISDGSKQCQRLADEIHAEICERGFDRELNSFVQAYG